MSACAEWAPGAWILVGAAATVVGYVFTAWWRG